MAKFIHSILDEDQAIAADGSEVLDLPVNPLTMILINIMPLNETSTITNYSLFEALIHALETVRVTHKGASVVDASGGDLALVAWAWHRREIIQSNAVETDDDRRSIVLPVIFGRDAYTPNECFPETKKGELQLTLTWDIADTGYDGLRRSIETVELPEASPEFVQKVTTLSQTFAATGQNDVEIPIGNVIRAILLWGTTSWAGAAPAPTWGRLALYANNLQTHYSASDWETLRAIMGVRGMCWPPDFRHIHSVNAAGAGREDTEEPEVGLSKDAYYALMDLDPTHDDMYSLETEGMSRVHVRSTAEAAEAVRVLPIERVPVAKYLEA